MNPIPHSFPDPAPPVRDFSPAPSEAQVEKGLQFQRMLDGKSSRVHGHEPSSSRQLSARQKGATEGTESINSCASPDEADSSPSGSLEASVISVAGDSTVKAVPSDLIPLTEPAGSGTQSLANTDLAGTLQTTRTVTFADKSEFSSCSEVMRDSNDKAVPNDVILSKESAGSGTQSLANTDLAGTLQTTRTVTIADKSEFSSSEAKGNSTKKTVLADGISSEQLTRAFNPSPTLHVVGEGTSLIAKENSSSEKIISSPEATATADKSELAPEGAVSESPVTPEPTETLASSALHARKKQGDGGNDSSGDGSLGSQYGLGLSIPVDLGSVVSIRETAAANGAEAVGKIEQIAALIAQTAQQVTFEGNDSVRINLSQEQLPDSKLIIQMTQQAVQVTFLSDNASSLSLLQARGGEVAAALALRFDREIRIEVKGGGVGSDTGESEPTLASWAIQGNSGGGSASGNG